MGMTVNHMLLLSRVFLGMMIIFIIAAIVIYFALDIRRAWRILTNKSVPVNHTKDKRKERKIQKNTSDLIKRELQTNKLQMQGEEITQLLHTGENIDNQYKGQDVTTLLDDSENTALLVSQNEQNNTDDIMLDITFIHTELVL